MQEGNAWLYAGKSSKVILATDGLFIDGINVSLGHQAEHCKEAADVNACCSLYCDLQPGHEGPHLDGDLQWWIVRQPG